MPLTLGRKLAIGTAQFGLSYGVSNSHGQITLHKADEILEHAFNQGISTLDTAIAYGNSEETLGAIGVSRFDIVTKLPKIESLRTTISSWVELQVSQSLNRLKVPKLHAIMLHNACDLLEPYGIELYEALCGLRDSGVCAKIGWSIYQPSELDQTIPLYKPDIIQFPFNPLDQRIVCSQWLEKLERQGTELHCRSIFLQGLLIMPPSKRPRYFDRFATQLREWDHFVKTQNGDNVACCLRHALSEERINKYVIGIEDLAQLKQILAVNIAQKEPYPDPNNRMPEELINPSCWTL